MAYKFQLGQAINNGSIVQEENITAVASEVTCSALTISDAIVMSGSSAAVDNLKLITAGRKLESDTSVSVGNGAAIFSLLNTDEGKFRIVDTAASTNPLFQIDATSGHGSLECGSETNSDGDISLAGQTGNITATGKLVIGGNYTCNGDMTIANVLTVNGAVSADDTVEVEIGSKVLQFNALSTNEAGNHGSLVELGKGSTDSQGASFYYATGSSDNNLASDGVLKTAQRHLAFIKGDEANFLNNTKGLPVRALNFIGDGTGVTTSGTGVITLGVIGKSLNDELEAGKVNYIANTNSGTGGDLNLPAASGVTIGDRVVIKLADTTAAPVRVLRAGSDTIDGETSFTLRSDAAAVKCIKIAEGKWALM